MPAPEDRKAIRSSKSLQLYRWEYVVRHCGLCTYAGIDKEKQRILAPGLEWTVRQQTFTVVAPFQLSGGSWEVALVSSGVLRDVLMKKRKTIKQSDVKRMLVHDIFKYCAPVQIVDLQHYRNAKGWSSDFVKRKAHDVKAWTSMPLIQSDSKRTTRIGARSCKIKIVEGSDVQKTEENDSSEDDDSESEENDSHAGATSSRKQYSVTSSRIGKEGGRYTKTQT